VARLIGQRKPALSRQRRAGNCACCFRRLWANPQSLLSLSGQIFRFVYGGYVASDAFIVILGVLLMGFIAWTAEWRERLRAVLANKPQSP
jgi:hypothetical protein